MPAQATAGRGRLEIDLCGNPLGRQVRAPSRRASLHAARRRSFTLVHACPRWSQGVAVIMGSDFPLEVGAGGRGMGHGVEGGTCERSRGRFDRSSGR
jgi:hypothetical protein